MLCNSNGRHKALTVVLLLFVATLLLLGNNSTFVDALTVVNKSVTVGTSLPSANTSHTIKFNMLGSSTVGSVLFEYCINDPFAGKPCVVPAGLNVSSLVIASQSGITGLTLDPSSTANRAVLTRSATIIGAVPVIIKLDNIVNPSTPQQSVYVRISTYTSSNATGVYNNEGGSVFTIQSGFGSQAYVPPFLIFCVGITVTNDCSSSNGAYAGLGELSKTSAKTTTSQFGGATNDKNGYVVIILGVTMTSGNNVIPALNVPTNSVPGSSQFGFNLRANTNPSGGQNPIGSGTLTPASNYANLNQFAFVTGSVVASSPLPTEFNTMTSTYLVNVSPNQQPGVYTTTLTYVATATF